MKYSTKIEIELPRKKVIKFFDTTDKMPIWQPEHISFKHLGGDACKREWITETELRYSGFMKVMAVFMSGAFKKQTFLFMK